MNKEFLKKKLEYKDFSISQQTELFGLSFEEIKKILSEMKKIADSAYRDKALKEAIELYLKGKFTSKLYFKLILKLS